MEDKGADECPTVADRDLRTSAIIIKLHGPRKGGAIAFITRRARP